MDTNTCSDCGHEWYPRTMTVSARCPECRSTDVSLCRDPLDMLKTGLIALVAVVAVPQLVLGLLMVYGVWVGARTAWDTVTT